MGVRAGLRQQLLEAGVRVLCGGALRGLQAALRREAIADATKDVPSAQGVSADTAYRLWRDGDAAVLGVAEHLSDLDHSGVAEIIRTARRAYTSSGPSTPTAEDGYEEQKDVFRPILVENFRQQFTAPGMPSGWALHAAALTASPLWKGTPPDRELLTLGKEILRARGDLYAAITESWSDQLRDAISFYRRRPRDPFTVEMLVQIMNALFDGCLLRMFADPRLNDPLIDEATRQQRLDWVIGFAVDAMFELAWSYTEPGSIGDPRAPQPGTEACRRFDALIDTSLDLYRESDRTAIYLSDDDFVQRARHRGIDRSSVTASDALFPDVGDLADSALRRLVVAGGNDELGGIGKSDVEFVESSNVKDRDLLLVVRAVLERVARASAQYPGLIQTVQAYAPTHPARTTPILAELQEGIAGALRRDQDISCPQPDTTAKDLLDLALAGSHGWRAVEAVLNTLAPTD